MIDLVDDLLSPEVVADPHPFFAVLREHDPAHWSEVHRAWIVSRYDDVAFVLTDRRFSAERVGPAVRASSVGPVVEMLSSWMVLTDPPAHTRLRRLAAGAFNPQRVAATEARIVSLVDNLLDAFVESGHFDLIEHFSYPLPAIVIAELIGAPVSDRARLRAWSQDLSLVAFGAGGEARADRHSVALNGLNGLLSYFGEQIERARSSPGEDMISGLLEGDGSGARLNDDEMCAMCALMLFAGHETTTTGIASGVLSLLAHPDQLSRARDACTPAVVEELLRFEGPIRVLNRIARADVELRGRRVRAGERVLVLPAAANRDPRRFSLPDRLDVGRSPNPHMAFGKGVHACIGAQLARMEMRIAIGRVLERLPGLRLADGAALEWETKLNSRSLAALWVAHDA